MNYYIGVLKKYAVFSGRARRAEFWYFFLINLIVSFVLGFVDGAGSRTTYFYFYTAGTIGSFYSLAILIPSLAVGVRRLHDIGKTGWLILVGLIPFAGWLILLYFYAQDSQAGQNQYGPNPKGQNTPAGQPPASPAPPAQPAK